MQYCGIFISGIILVHFNLYKIGSKVPKGCALAICYYKPMKELPSFAYRVPKRLLVGVKFSTRPLKNQLDKTNLISLLAIV